MNCIIYFKAVPPKKFSTPKKTKENVRDKRCPALKKHFLEHMKAVCQRFLNEIEIIRCLNSFTLCKRPSGRNPDRKIT